MNINCENKNRVLIVALNGDIDHYTSEQIKDKIDKEFERNNSRDLVLNFENVTFMDSSGIGMIIGRYKNASSKGGSLSAVNVNGEVKRIFEISGLFKLIKCYNDLNEAVNCLAGR